MKSMTETADKNEVKARFLGLVGKEKTLLLARLSHALTVSARSAYLESEGTVADRFRTLKGFNEIQHQVSSQLRNRLIGTNKTYPDDVFVNIVFEKAEQGGCEHELLRAFNQALKPAVASPPQ